MKIKLLITALIFTGLFSAFTSDNDKHIGWWKGTTDGDVAYFNFRSNGYMDMIMDEDTIIGDQIEEDGEKGSFTYRIDYSTDPQEIDFIASMIEDDTAAEKMIIRGIFKFDGPKMILCFSDEPGVRPTEFIEENSVPMSKANIKL